MPAKKGIWQRVPTIARESITVESGLPLPPKRNMHDETPLPFDKMKVGDSFFYDVPGYAVSRLAQKYAKRHDQRFSCREQEENGLWGTRCWRIE